MLVRLKYLCLLLAVTGIVTAQETTESPAYPEVVAFAENLTGITYNLRGTNNLKRLRFDGEAMHSVHPDGKLRSPYNTVFPDVGVVRLLFKNSTSGWYFFSDDMRYLTSVKVASERTFAVPASVTAKPVARFPQDIEEVVFESTDDGAERLPGKIRWNGEELEVGALQNGEWTINMGRPVMANRRVMELRATETTALWFVFSSDGKEAWLLEVEFIYGGQRSDLPAKAAVTAAESGLKEQQNDLANHLLDLVADGQTGLAGTLQRQFERELLNQPEILEKLKKRVNEG